MRAALPTLLAAAALSAPGVVDAGGSGSAGCNCVAPPPPCCNLPSTHTIAIPGVTVTPPSISLAPSRLAGGVGEGGGYGSSSGSSGSMSSSGSASSSSSGSSSSLSSAFSGSVSGDISVSVQAGASGSAAAGASLLAAAASNSAVAAQGYASPLATANSQAANLLAASGGSGGASFSEGFSGGSIPNLVVSTPGPAPAPREVCARTAASVQAVAVQAVCLDDKDVPHPASQVMPGAEVPEAYTGELFRCIAGAHMQYVTAAYAGEARFDHGQTVVCRKGESLWRDLGGRLQCRPQTPARDCNERSLLRRYGAGIKILKAAVAGQCVEWRTEGVQADAASQGSLQLDGGVGG